MHWKRHVIIPTKLAPLAPPEVDKNDSFRCSQCMANIGSTWHSRFNVWGIKCISLLEQTSERHGGRLFVPQTSATYQKTRFLFYRKCVIEMHNHGGRVMFTKRSRITLFVSRPYWSWGVGKKRECYIPVKVPWIFPLMSNGCIQGNLTGMVIVVRRWTRQEERNQRVGHLYRIFYV